MGKIQQINPKTQDVLQLLAVGILLTASVAMPGLGVALNVAIKQHRQLKRRQENQAWEKFNTGRLHQVLKRMYKARYIEIIIEQGVPTVKVTQKGKVKLLRYKLDEITLDKLSHDGKWRLIIYDVAKNKRASSESFRRMLRKLGFLQLQKSVYLTPYRCEEQIEYLRQLFDIGSQVKILTVRYLEEEAAYRRYFGIS